MAALNAKSESEKSTPDAFATAYWIVSALAVVGLLVLAFPTWTGA